MRRRPLLLGGDVVSQGRSGPESSIRLAVRLRARPSPRGWVDLVDAVEHVVGEGHVGRGELGLELPDRSRADDRRGDGRVADDERDATYQRDPSLVGKLGELLGGVEFLPWWTRSDRAPSSPPLRTSRPVNNRTRSVVGPAGDAAAALPAAVLRPLTRPTRTVPPESGPIDERDHGSRRVRSRPNLV